MGPAQAPLIQRLGKYQVVRHLATGGMAEIYLARPDAAKPTDPDVVVKVITRDRGQEQKFIQMFLDEARVAATLHHPHIAAMLEVGRHDDIYFLAMEYVDGDTVRALLERAVTTDYRVPLPVCLYIVMAVAAGLHHAHERKGANGEPLKIVHRDVTPSNIMVSWDGAVKLLDFGIAHASNRAAETQSGTIKGKFAYMSPEQCRGKGVDRRTDVFALGIVLYELTTQRRCFRTDSDFETMDRIVKGRVVKPTSFDASYPRDLEAILLTALATDADARYPSADALRAALVAYTQREGLTATAADVAACMRAAFGDGVDREELDLSVTHDVGSDDSLDAASTLRHVGASAIARTFRSGAELGPTASPPAPTPVVTGPMPVVSGARASSAVEVPPLAAAGGDTAPALVVSSLPMSPPTPPPGSRPAPVAVGALPPPPVDEWNTPQKTILGTGPLTPIRPPTSGPLATRPTPTPVPAPPTTIPTPAPAPSPLETVRPPTEPEHLRARQRRGLMWAVVAIVVVAAIATALVVLGSGSSDGAAPPPAPTAPP